MYGRPSADVAQTRGNVMRDFGAAALYSAEAARPWTLLRPNLVAGPQPGARALALHNTDNIAPVTVRISIPKPTRNPAHNRIFSRTIALGTIGVARLAATGS